MTEVKINQIILLADLLASILESVNHLAFHTEVSTLQEDSILALSIAGQQLKDLFPKTLEKPAISISELNKLFAATITKKTYEITKKWHDYLLNQLGNLLSDEIAPLAELTSETAAALLLHISKADYGINLKYALLLNASLCCGFSLPMASYDTILMLFKTMPQLLIDNASHKGYVYQESEQKTFESCLACGGKGQPYYCSFSYFMINFNNPFLPAKLWMKCEDCGNLFVYQFPKSRLMLSDNYKLIESIPTVSSICSASPDRLSLWCDILKHAMIYLKNGHGTNEDLLGLDLLEVGIGSGALLAVALELGCLPDAVEIEESSAQYVSNMLDIPIWNCDFLKYHTDKKYSMIVMGDVLEHVTDPRSALKKAHELLKEDGVLWLSTPNLESSFTRMKNFPTQCG